MRAVALAVMILLVPCAAQADIIAACYTSVTNAGGRLCVVEVPKPVRTLLELVCLWPLLGVYPDEEAAVQAAESQS